jgi:hypothetical protein
MNIGQLIFKLHVVGQQLQYGHTINKSIIYYYGYFHNSRCLHVCVYLPQKIIGFLIASNYRIIDLAANLNGLDSP